MISNKFSLGHCHYCSAHQTDHEYINDGDIGSGWQCPNGLRKAELLLKLQQQIRDSNNEKRRWKRSLQKRAK